MNFQASAITKLPEPVSSTLAALSDRYIIEEQNSEGGNGYVFIGTNRLLKTKIVVKFYNWEGEERYHLEPQALTEFNSKNVLKVLDAGVADHSWAYFVTPFCAEGSLESLVRSRHLGVIEAFQICSDVLDGLTYLHSARYIHRDLKPGNIYLDNGKAVIGDFGSLVALPDDKDQVFASRHSILYRPPESIASNSYGMAGDIYQVGVILYQLLGGDLPLEETAYLTKRELVEYNLKSYPDNTIFADDCLKARIARGKLLEFSDVNPWMPDCLVKLAKRACHIRPEKRFRTAAEFLGALAAIRSRLHDWSIKDDVLTLTARPTAYRIVDLTPSFQVQKRRGAAEWRNDRTCEQKTNIRALIQEIESR